MYEYNVRQTAQGDYLLTWETDTGEEGVRFFPSRESAEAWIERLFSSVCEC